MSDLNINLRHVFTHELTDLDITILASLMKDLDKNLDNVWKSGFNLRSATYDEGWYRAYLSQAKADAKDSGNILSGFFIATIEDIVVGYIYWTEAGNFLDGVQFNDIFVSNNFRRKGVGTAMMKYAIQFIKDVLHFRKFELEVITTNLPGMKLYEKLGFTKTIKYVLLKE